MSAKFEPSQFPVEKIRQDFPVLNQMVYNRPLVYFDNAATTQKPVQVIDAVRNYYEHDNCNIHRGVHFLSLKATGVFEETRKLIQQFINAASPYEIIYTKGTTESINLVAYSFGKRFLNPGDEVVVSVMEHHANFVPWQVICEERGAKLRYIPITSKGDLDFEAFKKLINEKTKLVSITHVSNVLGTITPVKEVIRYAHEFNVPVMVDGAQSIPHLGADVRDMDCDFYCFSGHKMYAPMGIGVLYGKEKYLDAMPPYQTGGEMIKEVSFEKTTFNELPLKFEAGTPNVEGVYGLRAAINYIRDLGLENIDAWEKELLKYATDKLMPIDGLQIIGQSNQKASLISFILDGIHHFDAGTIFDKMGIAVRTGHHCAMPLMEWLKISGTLRASFSFYNTFEEIDRLVEAIQKVKQLFG